MMSRTADLSQSEEMKHYLTNLSIVCSFDNKIFLPRKLKLNLLNSSPLSHHSLSQLTKLTDF